MSITVHINIFRLSVTVNLSLSDKSQLIRLLSLTVEKEKGIFPKSFIRNGISVCAIDDVSTREVVCCDFSYNAINIPCRGGGDSACFLPCFKV